MFDVDISSRCFLKKKIEMKIGKSVFKNLFFFFLNNYAELRMKLLCSNSKSHDFEEKVFKIFIKFASLHEN